MTRRGHYRLRRQHGGIGYFGEVTVAVLAGVDPVHGRVVWSVDPADRSSIQPEHDPEFVDAALLGAQNGLRLLDRLGVDTDELGVHVTHIQFDLTDIEVTAVRVAATVAVVTTHEPLERLSINYRAGWQVTVRPAG